MIEEKVRRYLIGKEFSEESTGIFRKKRIRVSVSLDSVFIFVDVLEEGNPKYGVSAHASVEDWEELLETVLS